MCPLAFSLAVPTWTRLLIFLCEHRGSPCPSCKHIPLTNTCFSTPLPPCDTARLIQLALRGTGREVGADEKEGNLLAQGANDQTPGSSKMLGPHLVVVLQD